MARMRQTGIGGRFPWRRHFISMLGGLIALSLTGCADDPGRMVDAQTAILNPSPDPNQSVPVSDQLLLNAALLTERAGYEYFQLVALPDRLIIMPGARLRHCSNIMVRMSGPEDGAWGKPGVWSVFSVLALTDSQRLLEQSGIWSHLGI